MNKSPVIFLMGATATGKTELAARLFDANANEAGAELISVDAAQVYRGMDIGTAKPDADFLRQYPHHLINIRAPDDTYSAAQFCEQARALIDEIHGRGKLPILVGGTMFYFFALENGLSELPASSVDKEIHPEMQPEIRQQITEEIAEHGLTAMHAKLQQVDPKLAETIRPTDSYRIQRALEIYRLTQQPPSEVFAQSNRQPLPFPIIKVGLFIEDRSILHKRIERRFKRMLEDGLVDEVQRLAASLKSPHTAPSMRSVGYRQVLAFLREEYGYEEMVEKGIAATRQLAKRQITWMRGWENLQWIEVSASHSEQEFSAAEQSANSDLVAARAQQHIRHQLKTL